MPTLIVFGTDYKDKDSYEVLENSTQVAEAVWQGQPFARFTDAEDNAAVYVRTGAIRYFFDS